MSNVHNDASSSSETKSVSFTVPLILASVLLFIIVLLLSVCDPKSEIQHENGKHNEVKKSH